jgi:hypothetical protein
LIPESTPSRGESRARSTTAGSIVLIAGFALVFAVRLVLLRESPGNYDTRSYEEVVGILERGGDLYRETDRYNYSPVWSVLLRGAGRVARTTGWSLPFVVGLLLLSFDSLTAAVLHRLVARRTSRERGLLAALLFFGNPVSVLVSSWHVQFDGVSIFFLVLAVSFATREVPRPSATVASLSASLLVKHVTWFHPLLFGVRGKLGRPAVLATLVPYCLFGISFLPYASSWREIRANVFEYSGLRSLYGFDVALLLPGMPDWLPVLLFLGAAGVSVVLLRRVEISRASLLLFLVLLVFIPGISRQYFVWPIALGSLFPSPGYLLYTLVASASFLQLSGPSGSDAGFGPGWYGPWWAAIAWLLWEMRSLRAARAVAS